MGGRTAGIGSLSLDLVPRDIHTQSGHTYISNLGCWVAARASSGSASSPVVLHDRPVRPTDLSTAHRHRFSFPHYICIRTGVHELYIQHTVANARARVFVTARRGGGGRRERYM